MVSEFPYSDISGFPPVFNDVLSSGFNPVSLNEILVWIGANTAVSSDIEDPACMRISAESRYIVRRYSSHKIGAINISTVIDTCESLNKVLIANAGTLLSGF